MKCEMPKTDPSLRATSRRGRLEIEVRSIRLLSFVGNAIWLMAAAALVLCGCTASYYRRDADNEAYRIVRHVEAQIFGRTKI